MSDRDVRDIAEMLASVADSLGTLPAIASSLDAIGQTLESLDNHIAELIDVDKMLP